jgi:hypothetical protein
MVPQSSVSQGMLGERRGVGVPVGGISGRDAAEGVVTVDLVQVVAAGVTADELHVHQPA